MKRAASIAHRASTVPWKAYLAVGVIAIAIYYALPLPTGVRLTIDVLFPLANVIAIVVGIRMYRPGRLRPWVLFAVGMTSFFVASVLSVIETLLSDVPVDDSPGQYLFESIGYVLVIAALVTLIYSRDGGTRDRSSLIDATIIVVGAAMVAWVFVLAPFAHDSTVPVADRLFKMLFPVANLILLAVSVRLAVTRGSRTPAFLMLLLAMLASLAGNTLSLLVTEDLGYLPLEHPIGIAFFLANVFAGAAPLHPSMRTLTDVGEYESRLSKTRIALFTCASMAGVTAYLIERARGEQLDVPIILAGSLVIFWLVLIRLSGLNTQMRRSEQRFRSLVLNASDVFAILEPDATIRYMSPAIKRVLGYEAEELNGKPCFASVHPDDIDATTRAWQESVADPGELYGALFRSRHKDGSWRWLEVSCTNLQSDPAVGGIVANLQDVTEKKEAEEALRVSEQSSRLLFESSPLPMWVYDLETLQFLAVNDTAVDHYGYSRDEFLGMTIADIRTGDELERLFDNLAVPSRDPLQRSGTWVHRLKDGTLIDVDVVSHSLEFGGRAAALVVAQDVTERKRVEMEKAKLELQLRQSQKLEAVGQLAGGVAHDFNNLLAVILNYARFVEEDVPKDSAAREDVEQILNAANKATRLVKQLLAFSRREIVSPEVMDVNEVVSEIQKMLMRTIKESVRLVVDLETDLWRTEADRGQLEQVLLNLAVNADAAMPSGGTLQIRTQNRSIDEDTAAQKAELNAGDYVCLSVSDDGAGMSEEVVAHIFEPFFTTKGIGEGTGLGLSTVYGIVKQAGGYIYVYSEEGRGTTFNIYLPASDATPIAQESRKREFEQHNGTEKILVVEDEDGVREIAERILTTAGYDVLAAPSPAAALALAKDGLEIDLLLTDVIMPGLSGRELAAKLQSARPGLKTIFMSGYTDEIIARQGVLEDGVTFLQKPFGADELLPLVRQALNNAQKPIGGRAPGVLIVDDDKPMREVLKLLLETSNFHVLGEAANGEQAVAMARDLHPDLIVLDHFMPVMSGAQAAPRLRDASPAAKICAFSAVLSETPSWADAFLSKERIGELTPMLEKMAV